MKIVLATLGSLGDLHPFIAIGRRLEAHGYEVVLATAPEHRDHVMATGLAFHPVGPSREVILRDLGMDVEELGRRIRQDTIFILEAGFKYLRATYDDLLPQIEGAALVITSTLMYSARFAAERLGIPQMTVALQPMVFVSAYDPPNINAMTWLAPLLKRLGPVITRPVFGLAKKLMTRRVSALHDFRRELRLPPMQASPIFEGQFTPLGTLATYSKRLGDVQPDFPPHTTITGFPFYDGIAFKPSPLAAELKALLASGPPPIVFTLGSFAVEFPGDFYRVSHEVAKRLKRRAVLLVGARGVEKYRDVRSADVFVGDYAPFSELFPHAQAIVHHGGIGTTGQALRAGRPQLVIPLFSDQFDNAARVVRLGVARSVGLKQYRVERVVAELLALLGDARYTECAAAVGREVSREDGAEVVSQVVDDILRKPGSTLS